MKMSLFLTGVTLCLASTMAFSQLFPPSSEISFTTLPEFQAFGIADGSYKIWPREGSTAGTIARPFIVAEGIDFFQGLDNEVTVDGLYMTLNSAIGGFAGDELRKLGYDVIAVNYGDSQRPIQENALLIASLIKILNDQKIGNELNVVTGASMGGLVCRYGLSWMEANSFDHETGIFLSFDSPQTGAAVPVTLQLWLEQVANGYVALALEATGLQLNNSPAARQMLLSHPDGMSGGTPGPHPSFATFFNDLESLNGNDGFPVQCRNISIANGSRTAVPNFDDQGGSIFGMAYSGDLLDGLGIINGFISVIPPDNYQQGIIAGGYDEIAAYQNCDVVWGCVSGPIDLPTESYDTAPGSQGIWFEAIVDAIEGLGISGVSAFTDQPYTCFIPTASALGLDLSYLHENLADDRTHLCQTPFDSYIASPVVNMGHVALDQVIANWVFEEARNIDSQTREIDDDLYSFNYTSATNNYIFKDIVVSNNGKLLINGNQDGDQYVRNAAESGLNEVSAPAAGSTIDVETACAGYALEVRDGGLLQLGDLNGNKGNLHILENSTIRIADEGVLRIHHGSRLHIDDGSKLIIGQDATVELLGDNAVIDLYGDIEIEDGATFTITYPGYSSGRIVIHGSGVNVYGTTNSDIELVGASASDIVLELSEDADLWPTNGFGQVNLSNMAITFENSARLNATSHTVLNDCSFDFTGTTSCDGLHIWRTNYISDCSFDDVMIRGQLFVSILKVYESTFDNSLAGIDVSSRGYIIGGCDFTNCRGVNSNSLTVASRVDDCTFDNADYNSQAAIFDASNVTIRVEDSYVDNSTVGIHKDFGELQLKCSTVRNANRGLYIGTSCRLNMSTDDFAGYNGVYDNNVNIELSHAAGMDLVNGYNIIKSNGTMLIQGSIDGNCNQCLPATLDASRNTWNNADPEVQGGPQPIGPNPNLIDLQYYDTACQSYDPFSPGCDLAVTDSDPQYTTQCGQHGGPPVVQKKLEAPGSKDTKGRLSQAVGVLKSSEVGPDNPLIFTVSYNGVAFEDALVDAATNMELYDSLGNDQVAVSLFNEILTSGLDRSNHEIRWKMVWGQQHMKTAFENMFTTGEINTEDNEEFFHTTTQHYVDVLNVMTDTLVTDTTYLQQFAIELDKAQLFRTIGGFNISYELLENVDDCSLDSLEQTSVNNWLGVVQSDIQIQEQMEIVLDLDDLSVEIDSSEYVEPITYVSSEYYFGATILGPESIVYSLCNGYEYKLLGDGMTHGSDFQLFPNPNYGTFRIQFAPSEGVRPEEILIYSSFGQLVRQFNVNGNQGNLYISDLNLSPGTYMIIHTVDGQTAHQKIMIVE